MIDSTNGLKGEWNQNWKESHNSQNSGITST